MVSHPPHPLRSDAPVRRARDEAVADVRGILDGAKSAPTICDQIEALVDPLKRAKEWWWAREFLAHVNRIGDTAEAPLPPGTAAYVRQQLALCTYKDPELRRASALEIALRLVVDDEGNLVDPSSESAGIAGAISKR